MIIISAPEPKAQVHYCDYKLSVVRRPSVVRPSLTFTFLTSPLKPLNRIQRKLTWSKISMSSTKFVFSGRSEKQDGRPRALIGWDTFDFFSKTAEGNSKKLDRKQELNVLYQVCVFRADRKNKMAAPGIWLAETFLTSPLKPLNRIGRNLTGSKISMCSTKFVFFGPIRKTRWPPWPQICWDIFWLLWRNRLKEFHETWQGARSPCPLLSLCFSGLSENQDGRPGLWLMEMHRLRHLII